MRILLAFDSFKGSLSSEDVSEAFAAGWQSIRPDDSIDIVPIADGGEGTMAAMSKAMGGELCNVVVSDPLGRSIEAAYGYVESEGVAIVDTASASGLTLLASSERNPMLTTSYGTGEIIAASIRRGCRRIYLGLGGSATNDGGMGLLRALGYRFYDAYGEELMGCGRDLCRVSRIDASQRIAKLDDVEFIVASDVDNPLYGERGAAYVYGRQKGGDTDSIALLDRGLRHYSSIVEAFVGQDFSQVAGAGAAGGIGFALIALLGATLRSGIDTLLDMLRFDERVAVCDLVVTGEGRIDHQTLMGKAPSGVLRRAVAHGRKCIAVGGGVVWCDELHAGGFAAIYAATPEGQPLEEAMSGGIAKENVRRIASHIAQSY
ncbi:MAG: glycerate kinase [Alistipes sp.]|nr:glycerate kinase [Alistipes sp.]